MRNEIKIRFEEPEYEVNPEKGTVKCFLRYEVLYPDFLQGVFFYGEKIYFFSKAIAKVNEGYVFNESIGKKISLAKAEKKAYAKVRKRLIKRWYKIADTLNVVGGFIDKAFDVIDHNNNYLEQWN
jgi:hypothetical protein